MTNPADARTHDFLTVLPGLNVLIAPAILYVEFSACSISYRQAVAVSLYAHREEDRHGGDDVQQLLEAGEEEFLEIMALVGMAKKPLHVRRLQKALQEYTVSPTAFQLMALQKSNGGVSTPTSSVTHLIPDLVSGGAVLLSHVNLSFDRSPLTIDLCPYV
ncbi:unnamed protein product [Soboliphyme baturini]|uniref:NCD1 domain-containing protein n=1 Tax=Soboliphyme baturini TaxID=241478 RepID=A0A183J4J3_9BILA|nr:unnamed protein product [Soboliphyme baturini]